MKIVEQQRLQKLEHIEKLYQDAMSDDYIIKWKFGYRSADKVEGIPPPPKEDSFIETRFEVDHILAICLGGDEWDEENLQVLCYTDHKAKTKIDMVKLREKRKKAKHG